MAHKNIRRKDRELTAEQAIELLVQGEYGVLSTVDKDHQPYGVPLSYVFQDGCLYFHCALEGHKLENIVNNQKVAFCVVGKTRVLPEKFSTNYESVIAFGDAAEVLGEERQKALVWLLEKYSPDFMSAGRDYIERKKQVTGVIKIEINHISGKARK